MLERGHGTKKNVSSAVNRTICGVITQMSAFRGMFNKTPDILAQNKNKPSDSSSFACLRILARTVFCSPSSQSLIDRLISFSALQKGINNRLFSFFGSRQKTLRNARVWWRGPLSQVGLLWPRACFKYSRRYVYSGLPVLQTRLNRFFFFNSRKF